MDNLSTILLASAAITVIVGVVLLAVISPLVGGIVIVVGLTDLGLSVALRNR
jgi:hypothetical protein